MTFDLEQISAAVARHQTVARILVVGTKGSVPREVGTSMLVWNNGQSGTIGGGTLEHEATLSARAALVEGHQMVTRALGPDLGQCCGGVVELVIEVFDAERLAEAEPGQPFLRSIGTAANDFARKSALAEMRRGATLGWKSPWLAEAPRQATQNVWIWGAGHVGRALVDVLSPLPDIAVTWVDTDLGRFPLSHPEGVRVLPVDAPARAMQLAPAEAHHIIVTVSHALDLELCHTALGHGFRTCGLIGSKTKWARFRKRLAEMGHRPAEIARITCPIGDPALGKHPQAIAIGVAHRLVFAMAATMPAQIGEDAQHARGATET